MASERVSARMSGGAPPIGPSNADPTSPSANRLQANIPKLHLIQACRWFLLLMPVLVLFYQENGLSLQDVFIIQAFYSVCVILCEIPSGYMADRIGRKQSLLIGSVFAAAGFGVYAFSYTFSHFLTSQVLIAIGASFISGSDSALLYDTLLQLKRQGEYQKVAGRLASISNFSEGIAGIIGGFLALISLRTPLQVQAVLVLAAIPLAASLVEPARQNRTSGENSLKAILRIVRYALHGHSEVKWLILYSSLVGTSTFTIVWFVQPYFTAVDLPLAWFGVGWAALQFSVGLFAYNAYRIEAWLGRRTALISLILLAAAAYLVLGFFQTLWALPFLFVFYLARGINGPVQNDYINRCVSSDMRATVLSVKSLVGRLMFVLLGPLVGWLSDSYSLGLALGVCGLVFLVFGLVFLGFLHRNKVL
ncbi:MAG: MFS transporter [Candidatus Latescibacteria bacterium]|nr:MFS transporter [Candidatus Latescibacterota bacterium]